MSDWKDIERLYMEDDDSPTSEYRKLCEAAKPSDFYFAITTREEDNYGADSYPNATVFVYLVPVAFFDLHGYFPDCYLDIKHIVPLYQARYSELTLFLSKEDLETVRQKMLEVGFIENQDLRDFILEVW
jgi:hypothetical protein